MRHPRRGNERLVGVSADPSRPGERLSHFAAREYFTNRENAIEIFQRYARTSGSKALPVLVFYGVGGIGKTALVQRLAGELRSADPPVPHALFSMENIGDQTRAYREVLLRWRCDLESQFRIAFPRFDLCYGVMLAREGGTPPSLVQLNPSLRQALQFGTTLITYSPLAGAPGVGGLINISLQPVAEISKDIIKRIIERSPGLEVFVRRVVGTEDVVRLRDRALRNEETLPAELIWRFAQDLKEHLPTRKDAGCHGVLFLDTYEMLWSGREAIGSAQAWLLDEWVRTLAQCLGNEVLLVITGRDQLAWADSDPELRKALDQHRLGGMSARDGQTFLARCGIGAAPVTPASVLQRAIIACCNESKNLSEVSAHPMYLALCAEIVLNTRSAKKIDPKPETFTAIPSPRVAQELATRFLRSLHSSALELWIQELSLTPRFDAKAALTLDKSRDHQNGRSGWTQMIHFSFINPQPDGFYRLHKTMREVLRTLVDDASAREVHEWFRDYWTQRSDLVLAWYHRWTLNPEGTLREWEERHEGALRDRQIAEARQLLTLWAEITLDESDRRRVGDEVWANTHRALAYTLLKTPIAPRTASLTAAIAHYRAALQIFTEAAFPLEWASTQHNLGFAYEKLPTGDRAENLRQAIACYQAALRVRTEADFPQDWAATQTNLGISYAELPVGDRVEHMWQAIACYQAALRVQGETDFPYEWARTQHNLGLAYAELPTGNQAENLQRAIACYQAALRVWTEADFPQDWAATQNNLGLVYRHLPTGGQAENLRQAIAFCQAALRVRTEADFPYEWASTQHNLGLAYSELPAGDRAENLRQGITCYEAALRVWTESDFPQDWARTQHNLGIAYAELPAEDQIENLRRAIACYQAALRVRTEADFPYEWARTQHYLGLACAELSTGDQAENLQRAIGCYQAALRVWTEADFPPDWADTQHDLGEAYRKLPTGDKESNLHTAIDHFEAALKVRTEIGSPRDWAETQHSLGLVYQDLVTVGGNTWYSAKAKEHFAAARRVTPPSA